MINFNKNKEIKEIEKNNPQFPLALKNIPQPPSKIYLLGEFLNQNQVYIAIVGTRKATQEGKLIAKKIAYELAKQGIIIVSGLALGIDAAAHQGALLANQKTIAVLANGLDKIYPKIHENLAKQIIEKKGTIISEYPPKTPPLPHQFLERNRLISGLSLATVIIEAPLHSGALVTAKNALDQGKEVFVVPGSPLNKNYEGSHLLIRYGARLITNADEIIEDLKNSLPELNIQRKEEETNFNLKDEVSKLILETLTKATQPLTIDQIIEITKLKPYLVSQKLTFLTLEELIIEKNGWFQINHR